MTHKPGLPPEYFRKCSGQQLFLSVLVGIIVCLSCTPKRSSTPQPSHASAAAGLDTAAIQQLLAEGRALYTQDSFLSDSVLKAALYQSQQTGYALGAFGALRNLALNARSSGDYQKMLSLLVQATPYAKETGNLPGLYNNIGMAHLNLGNYGQALHYYTHALDPENSRRTHKDSVFIYINTGFLWDAMEEHSQALNYYLKAKHIALSHRDSSLLDMTLLYTADGYYYKDLPEKAVPEYKQALAIARKTGDLNIEYPALYSLAMTYIKQGKYDSARSYLLQTQSPRLQNEAFTDHKLASQEMWGALYLALEKPREAIRVLTPALASARANNLHSIVYETEPKLAKAYFALGRYKEAYQHQEAYLLINDSLLKQEKVQLLNELTNVRIAAQERSMMGRQLRNIQEKQTLERKNVWLGGAIGILLLLIGAILLALRAYRSKQTIQQATILQLRQSQEINQLKAQIRGEEQERERVARELHDGIASQLWAIMLHMNNLQQQSEEKPQWKAEFAAIYLQLRDASQNVRRTAHNLMPDLLLQEGLSAALASVCERTSQQSGLEVDFQEYGQIPRFDPETELSIFRIVQELIQNTLKHATGATYLLVQVSCTDTLLNITVEDNGPGFAKDIPEGMGLFQIRKRVQALKGHFELEAAHGKGTAAYLEFDLRYLI